MDAQGSFSDIAKACGVKAASAVMWGLPKDESAGYIVGAIGAFIATCIFCIVWVSLIRIIGMTDSFGRNHNNYDGRKGLLSTSKSHGYDTY